MKLWIIYKQGLGFSKLIAEMLQDRLEDYIDVAVGIAEKIDPKFLIEEKLDYLIIGDHTRKISPNLEIHKWLLKFEEITKQCNYIIKTISGFFITSVDRLIKPPWMEFFQEFIIAERIYPPILCLKFDKAELALEERALEEVKDYSDDFIDFLINNESRYEIESNNNRLKFKIE